MKLDFSQYHALDHLPFTKYCRSQYGGWRTHLRYGWDLKWRDNLRRHTLCRVGRHRMVKWSRGPWFLERGYPPAEWRACRACMREEKRGKRSRREALR